MFTFDELKKQLGWKQKLAIGVLAYWIKEQLMFGVLTGWLTKSGAVAAFATALAALFTAGAHVLTAISTSDWAGAGAAWPEVLGAAALVSLTMQHLGVASKVERQATGELKQEVIAAESAAGKR